jgi:ppGpp synthetase/RelA/SpoT-type nucleotidyltranferase
MTEHEYALFVRPYERAVKQLKLEFDFFLQDAGPINVYSIEDRIKSFASAREKEQRLAIPIQEMRDIAGLRIVAATARDIEVVVRFFTRKADSQELQVVSDDAIVRANGYRARHLIVNLGAHHSRAPADAMVEVQLFTLAQHAFNYISRQWVYKADYELPEGVRESLAAISEGMAAVDRQINVLYDRTIVGAAASSDASPMTPHSYRIIVRERFGHLERLDHAVDAIRWLGSAGLRTNGDLRAFFESPRIAALMNRIERTSHPSVAYLKNLCHTCQGYLFIGPRIDYIEKELDQPAEHDPRD